MAKATHDSMQVLEGVTTKPVSMLLELLIPPLISIMIGQSASMWYSTYLRGLNGVGHGRVDDCSDQEERTNSLHVDGCMKK